MNNNMKPGNNDVKPVSAHPDPVDPNITENKKPLTEHPDPVVPNATEEIAKENAKREHDSMGAGHHSGPAAPHHGDSQSMPHNASSETDGSDIRGEVTYDDKVVQKIIGIALDKIDGLLTVDGGFFSNVAGKLVNTDNPAAGINTEVGKKQVAVDMDVVVEYGRNIKEIYNQMKTLIHDEVKKMTDLEVIEVNVNVADIKSKEEYEEDSDTVQNKMSRAAATTGEFASRQTNKAKHAVNKGVDKVQENREPRVE